MHMHIIHLLKSNALFMLCSSFTTHMDGLPPSPRGVVWADFVDLNRFFLSISMPYCSPSLHSPYTYLHCSPIPLSLKLLAFLCGILCKKWIHFDAKIRSRKNYVDRPLMWWMDGDWWCDPSDFCWLWVMIGWCEKKRGKGKGMERKGQFKSKVSPYIHIWFL
jgi:hypothetical protein